MTVHTLPTAAAAPVAQTRSALITIRARRNVLLYKAWLSQPVGRAAYQEGICREIRKQARAAITEEAFVQLTKAWAWDEPKYLHRQMDIYLLDATVRMARKMAEIEVASDYAAGLL